MNETIKTKIINIMKNKEKTPLKDLYVELDYQKPSIRNALNKSINVNEGVFVRLSKGVYGLKK